MSLTYLGSRTLADTLPGVAAILKSASDALDAARAVIGHVRASLSVHVDAIHAARLSLRIAAVADLEAQLGALLALVNELSKALSDPAAYLAGLLAGLVQVQANVKLLLPSIALPGQISAGIAAKLELEAKIAALDALFAVLAAIADAIGQLAASMTLDITLPVLPTAAGLYLYVYDGTVADFGNALSSALSAHPDLGASATVHAPVLVARSSNTSLRTSLDVVFGLTG